MIRRQYYGWIDRRDGLIRLSLKPHDAPIRPSVGFEEPEDARDFINRKRARVYWWPPLPNDLAEVLSDQV